MRDTPVKAERRAVALESGIPRPLARRFAAVGPLSTLSLTGVGLASHLS